MRHSRSTYSARTAYASWRCRLKRPERRQGKEERREKTFAGPVDYCTSRLSSLASRRADTRMISLSHYLVLGAILFAISVIGIFLNRKNVIILLMAIELMLLAVNMNFIAFSHYLNDPAGQIFVFFILTVAAAESAIGLAILVVLFRNVQTINVDDLDHLKG